MSNGRKIIEGLDEAIRHARGENVGARERVIRVPHSIDVKAIREKLNLSQAQFAMKFGFNVATVRNWEQGLRVPDGHTRAFLTVIDREPEIVLKALSA